MPAIAAPIIAVLHAPEGNRLGVSKEGLLIGEGEWVALHSFMTGTHQGDLRPPLLLPGGPSVVPATGRPIKVAHMHLIRCEGEQGPELWHVMDTMTMALMGQLGLLPGRHLTSSGATPQR